MRFSGRSQKYHNRLKRHDESLHIQPDLLCALLTVADFKHGARSLEAIISMLHVHSGGTRLDWLSLPPDDQLEMYVSVRQLKLAGKRDEMPWKVD